MKIARKIQKSGKSTYLVSLPKTWCIQHNVEKNTPINLDVFENHLIITPDSIKKQQSEIIFTADEKDYDITLRQFFSVYLGGYDIIIIRTPNLSPEMKEKVRRLHTKVAGLEITEEDANHIVFQDFFDITLLSVKKSLERINTQVYNMQRDAIESLVNHNVMLAQEVDMRDTEVNRTHMLIVRQLNKQLISVVPQSDPEIEVSNILNYFKVVRSLERIGDHSARIARKITTIKENMEPQLLKSIKILNDDILLLRKRSMDAFFKRSIIEGNNVIVKGEQINEKIHELKQKIAKKKVAARLQLNTIVDSMDRINFYTVDIGEATIDTAYALKEKL